ncbi:MAG: hypothetical protein JXR22_09850 [Prolixibacteraceae bacterium]|nr:hypothetical protein [Prolixibacteraceae bacterium]
MKTIWNQLVAVITFFKNHRLKEQYRKPFRLMAIGLLLILLFTLVYPPISNFYRHLTQAKGYGKIKVDWYRDLNPVHLKYAKANGIKPYKKNKDFHNEVHLLVKNDQLVRVNNTRNYTVKRLTHSHPYLTPDAVDLLDDLGKRFRKKLKQNELGSYAYQVSSLLRTEESQKGLSRSNRNASPNTSHLYGTTFDIAYNNVVKKPLPWMKVEVADARVIKLLSEAIGELRSEGRCVVVTEKHETCFHITVVP